MKGGKVGDDGASRGGDHLTCDPVATTTSVDNNPLGTGVDEGANGAAAIEDPPPSTISLEKIFFAIGDCAPTPESLTVYETMERSFRGHELVFNIIGQSHYIYSRDGAFRELCSCVPLDHLDERDTETIALTLGNEQTLGRTDSSSAYRTTVTVLSLDDFPRREYDLSHRFAPDAYTTIDLMLPFFETHHTYPERDIAVRTRSKLTF